MPAAIHEVDLGINQKLEDVEHTEKAKRTAPDLQERRRVDKDELVTRRFYRGRGKSKLKTDGERFRGARLSYRNGQPA